jgi:hypothetical protein
MKRLLRKLAKEGRQKTKEKKSVHGHSSSVVKVGCPAHVENARITHLDTLTYGLGYADYKPALSLSK